MRAKLAVRLTSLAGEISKQKLQVTTLLQQVLKIKMEVLIYLF